MTKEVKFLKKIVKQASKLVKDNFSVRAKDDLGDLVTEFDYKIEKFLISKIKKAYPKFDIVSEEFNTGASLTENCFTIDPIDGTVNFAHGLPNWGIQVACVKNGKTCASVIYLPRLNELYYADESGAYLNGKSIHVNNLPAKQSLFVIEGTGDLDYEKHMLKTLPRHNRRFIYCACLHYSWVACGRLGGEMLMKDTVWDYLPGMYLIEKAGGVVYDLSCVHIGANSKELADKLLETSKIKSNNKKKVEK